MKADVKNLRNLRKNLCVSESIIPECVIRLQPLIILILTLLKSQVKSGIFAFHKVIRSVTLSSSNKLIFNLTAIFKLCK